MRNLQDIKRGLLGMALLPVAFAHAGICRPLGGQLRAVDESQILLRTVEGGRLRLPSVAFAAETRTRLTREVGHQVRLCVPFHHLKKGGSP